MKQKQDKHATKQDGLNANLSLYRMALPLHCNCLMPAHLALQRRTARRLNEWRAVEQKTAIRAWQGTLAYLLNTNNLQFAACFFGERQETSWEDGQAIHKAIAVKADMKLSRSLHGLRIRGAGYYMRVNMHANNDSIRSISLRVFLYWSSSCQQELHQAIYLRNLFSIYCFQSALPGSKERSQHINRFVAFRSSDAFLGTNLMNAW